MNIILDREEQDKETRELSDKFVSKILVYAIMTELHLISIITFEMTKKLEDRIHFIEYFDQSTFERKINLVEIILKFNYPKIFQQYKNTIVQIKQIKDARNRIAHHIQSYEMMEIKLHMFLVRQ